MRKLLSILTILFLSSYSYEYDKAEVMEYFPEINQLNTILLKKQNQLAWKNNPDSVSSEIEETKEIIKLLQEKLNLTEIESHDTVRFKENIQKSGLAYYFGSSMSRTENYSILIYAEDKETLDLFMGYEQFSDCSGIQTINQNWAFAIVDPDCGS